MRAALRDLTVIVLSGSLSESDVRDSYREGADRFLAKPLGDADALEIVAMCEQHRGS